MLTTGAVIHGDRARLMGFDAFEQPLAFQLGGSEPRDLPPARGSRNRSATTKSTSMSAPVGPRAKRSLRRLSDAATSACRRLRARDEGRGARAGDVKCRIGVDEQPPRAALFDIAERVLDAGADALIVHARKAWLKGLSPKENRDIPPPRLRAGA